MISSGQTDLAERGADDQDILARHTESGTASRFFHLWEVHGQLIDQAQFRGNPIDPDQSIGRAECIPADVDLHIPFEKHAGGVADPPASRALCDQNDLTFDRKDWKDESAKLITTDGPRSVVSRLLSDGP